MRGTGKVLAPLWAVLVALAILVPSTATAQYVDRDDNVRLEEEFDENEFYIGPRIRAIAVPKFILDLWFDEHANHWQGRTNLSYGLEFVWRKVDQYEISTAFDYAQLGMEDDFWLEKGDNPDQADYTEVDLQVASLVVSGYWYWDVQEWFSPYVGGGIGAGLVLGDIVKFDPRPGTDCTSGLGQSSGFAPNSCFGPNGEPDPSAIDLDNPEIEEGVPPVVPIVNLSGGARFNIADHGVIKLEMGFYDYFFVGLSGGYQW